MNQKINAKYETRSGMWQDDKAKKIALRRIIQVENYYRSTPGTYIAYAVTIPADPFILKLSASIIFNCVGFFCIG
jgi:hypothetical protein